VDVTWTGTGSKYVEGVQDPTFTARYLRLSTSVAKSFIARYPKLIINWYLTYEANLNELYYPAIENAYATLLHAEMQALSSLRPHATFAWSPAFWYPYAAYRSNLDGMVQLRQMLTKLLATLRTNSPGLGMLDLQDFVAGSSCEPPGNRVTPDDAVNWLQFLKSLTNAARETVINTEQYSFDCGTGGVIAGDAASVTAREAFYATRGVQSGPAFEIRYWMPNHDLTL
jgi:hypothetical protein